MTIVDLGLDEAQVNDAQRARRPPNRKLTSNAGPWSGALITRLNSGDPDVTRFGPSRIELANGQTQANPLASGFRLVGENRGEGCDPSSLPDNGVSCDGQARAPTINSLGLKIGKIFRLGNSQEFEVSGNLFNLLNSSDHHQFTYSNANRTFSGNFAQLRSLQAAQAFQLSLLWRF